MREIKVLMIIALLCYCALMSFTSISGPLIRGLNLREWHAGVIVAFAGIIWMLTAKYWGRKSDQIGRKKILMVGVLGFSLSYLALAIFIDISFNAPMLVIVSLSALMIIRAINGAFHSAAQVSSFALIADKSESKYRASFMAKLGMAAGAGMVIGPLMGGVLSSYSLATPIYIVSLSLFIMGFVLFFTLKEESCEKTSKKIESRIFDKRLFVPIMASFLTMFSYISLQMCIGFFIIDTFNIDYEASVEFIGYALALIGIFTIIAQMIVVKMVDVQPIKWLQFGSIFAFCGIAMMAFSQTFLIFYTSCVITSFGLGMIIPSYSALAANLVNTQEQGMAAGSVSSAQGLSTVIAPLVCTLLYGLSSKLPFIVAASTFIILFLTTIRFQISTR